MINHMPLNTLEKKIYQLIISRLDGEYITSESYQEKIFGLVEKGIGGFIVFGGKKDEVKNFIGKIQSISEMPCFIASDIERGVGQQILGNTIFPSQMAMAAAIDKNRPDDITILENAIRAIADEAKGVGINMPLIPVLDINQNPDNPIICTRAFSENPEDVTWFGSKYIRILEEAGLVSCAKHFPGHGDTSVDSHISLPVIRKSYKELMDMDILPFKEAIKTGVSSIMVGHLSIPAIDSKPASLSKNIITNLLREGLGFNGLILTDALNMNALKGIKNIPVECIKAGADILLHPLDLDLTVKELVSAIESKEIDEDQIDTALDRILKAKKKLQNTTTPLISPLLRGELGRGEVDYHRHEEFSSLISEMSVTLVKKTKGILPISGKDKALLVLSGDSKFFESSPLKTVFKDVSTIADVIELKDRIVIFVIFTTIAAWTGSSGIGQDERDRINELIRHAKNSVVISFGNPYVLRHFDNADILIAVYEATDQAQKAVVKHLIEKMDFKGRLPVKYDFNSNGKSY
ncbi:MAG: glycoside hydrolase family 3 N-terminal domain-containing protein [Nitrospirota bacterium]